MCELLISVRANLCGDKDENGARPLELAAKNGFDKIVELICATAQSKDPMALSQGLFATHATGALLRAAEEGHSSVCRVLLAHKANPRASCEVLGHRGGSALMLAANQLNVEVLRSLLDHQANPDVVTAGGHSALQLWLAASQQRVSEQPSLNRR